MVPGLDPASPAAATVGHVCLLSGGTEEGVLGLPLIPALLPVGAESAGSHLCRTFWGALSSFIGVCLCASTFPTKTYKSLRRYPGKCRAWSWFSGAWSKSVGQRGMG